MLRQRIGHVHTGGLCPNVPGCNGAIVIFQESRLGIYIQTDVCLMSDVMSQSTSPTNATKDRDWEYTYRWMLS